MKGFFKSKKHSATKLKSAAEVPSVNLVKSIKLKEKLREKQTTNSEKPPDLGVTYRLYKT
jgi:hypothetical protein